MKCLELVLLLLNICLTQNVSLLNSTTVKSSSTLSAIVYDISIHYFNFTKCLAYIYDFSSDINFYLLHYIPVYHINITDKRNNAVAMMAPPLEANCLGFILIVHNISSILDHLLAASRYTVQRQSRKYFAILAAKNVETVLSLPQLRFTPDFILVTENNGTYELWTQNFVGATSEEQTTPVLVDVWSNGTFRLSYNTFPVKLHNLMGRELKFATFYYSPYAILNAGALDGTEGRLFIEFSRELNFSWSVVTDDFQWGEILDDASGNGILGTVSEDRADFGFGALYLWYHEYQYVDFSVPYIRTGITCLAPRPPLLSGWRAPTLPFTAKLWIVVAASLLLSALLICICANIQRLFMIWLYGSPPNSVVRRLCKPLDCVFLVLGMSVLAAPPDIPLNASALKHCLNWFLIQCLLVATSYASALVSFMTVPQFAAPIDTATDIAHRGLHWAATHDAWAFSLREATDPVHSRVYQLFLELDEERLAKEATSGKMAFSVERLPAGHFAVGDYVATEQALPKLRLMKHDLYWEMVVTVVRKGSPYLDRLNQFIHRLSASGILLHWEGEVARKYLSSRHQLAIKISQSSSSDEQGPTILTIFHLQGVFFILTIGLSLSLCVFCFEIICSASCKNHNKGNLIKVA